LTKAEEGNKMMMARCEERRAFYPLEEVRR